MSYTSVVVQTYSGLFWSRAVSYVRDLMFQHGDAAKFQDGVAAKFKDGGAAGRREHARRTGNSIEVK